MDFNKFFGWAGQNQADDAWQIHKGFFLPSNALPVVGSQEVSVRLWDFVKKVLGDFTKNYPQQTGDCVAFGAKNAIEYVSCIEIAKGDAELFKNVYAPYLYAIGRVLIGNGRLRGKAGSIGSWMAKAVIQHGTIPADLQGLPPYAGSISDAWGDDRLAQGGDFRNFLEIGRTHLIRSAARIENWDQLVGSIAAGYPCTIASNAGFTMKAGRDGYHARSGSWPHQMCFVAVSNKSSRPWAGLLNSWGDVHGRIEDFETGEPWPIGTLRITREAAESMIRSGECFAYSQFDGFPMQDLPWGSMIG
jgi:hypothetical protein